MLKEISFVINKNDRIGLVGKNGAGKSTLMKIIMGMQQPTSGQVVIPSGTTTGYLPQEMKHHGAGTVYGETARAFSEVLNLEGEIEKLNVELATRTDYESDEYHNIIARLTEATERYHFLEGDNREALIEQTLKGLGFDREDFDRPVNELSGGWRMRIEIAKLLLLKPDILLLDEPTNHLDIESIEWIETFLKDYPGAIILVSHDRTFLDTVTNRTIEIALAKIFDYNVSFSKFETLSKERRAHQMAAFQNQQKMIEDTEKFIERFRYKATKAVQVQSRIKQLEKLERIEVEEEDVSRMNIRFQPPPRAGSIIFEAENLSKRYDDNLVLDKIDFVIERGEKVAFIGRNGEGKTTLSKVLAGFIDYTGDLKTGHNVSIGYFAQNQDELLNQNYTVLETIDRVAVGDIRTRVRDILGAFLFRGEDVDKKVKVLSGGEKSRLALARLLLEPYNVLILDEPTNHLDMHSKDILKNALLNYDGTLIIVSHDRDFLNGLTTKHYEFRKRKIKEHLGTIYEFLQKKRLASLKELERKEKPGQEKGTDDSERLSDSKREYLVKKELERELRKAANKITACEKEIEKLESEMEMISGLLANPENLPEGNSLDSLSKKYNSLEEIMTQKMEEWEKLTGDYETIKKSG